MTTTTALVPLKSYAVIRRGMEAFEDMIRENMGTRGFDISLITRVKVPAGGATTWTIPGARGEEETKELTGVIVAKYDPRAYWKAEYSGKGTQPDCFSNDSRIGVGMPGGECASCEFNQWGSDPKGGRGKACAERIALFILRPSGNMPVRLLVPPTSIKPMTHYFYGLIADEPAYAVWQVQTTLRLERLPNAQGQDFSRIVPIFAGVVADEEMQDFKTVHDTISKRVIPEMTYADVAEDFR